jgi:hypothetical protein
VHGLAGWASRVPAEFLGDQPLRLAWMHDTLSESIGVAGLWKSFAWGNLWSRNGRHDRAAGWGRGVAWALGGIAACLTLVLGLLAVDRQVADAESTIRVNAISVASQVVPPVQPEPEIMTEPAPLPRAEPEIPANALAQAEPVRLPAAPPPPVPDGNGASKTAAPPRVGYDLEHGIPMPPDARDARPVY